MRATVVYESLLGRTREVAEAVAEGLRAAAPGAVVDCRPVVDAGPDLGQVDLLVVGGPTHFWG
jgi:flavodoxin